MARSLGATTLLWEVKLVAAHVWSGQSPGQWSESRSPCHTRMAQSPRMHGAITSTGHRCPCTRAHMLLLAQL